VKHLYQVVPIETPDDLRRRHQKNLAAANRVFYLTSRFRQQATTERFRWLTESLRRHLGDGPLSTTLVADHPYFGGTGLGMGMGPNPAWGRAVLAADVATLLKWLREDVLANADLPAPISGLHITPLARQPPAAVLPTCGRR